MSSPVWWYVSRATGLVALVLLSGTMVLGVLTSLRVSGRSWPGFAQQELHRRVALLAVVFVALHVLTAVLDTYVHIGWAAAVVPLASPYQRVGVAAGAVSVDLMAAVVVTSLLRHRVPARAWRVTHWLVYASWPVAVAHSIALGTDMRLGWVLGLTVACIAAVVAAAAARLVDARRRAAGSPVTPEVPGARRGRALAAPGPGRREVA